MDPYASAYVLGMNLLATYGLSPDWVVTFDRAKVRAGLTNFETKTITLSENMIGTVSDHELRNILLHEIAHALVGPLHGHDDVWRAKALEIGCDGCTYHTLGPFVEPLWTLDCPCGMTHMKRHVLRKDSMATYACKFCMGFLRATNRRTGETVDFTEPPEFHSYYKYSVTCGCGGVQLFRRNLHKSLLDKMCPACQGPLLIQQL